MKILLTTLNSKFIHSSLALRYLRAFCADKSFDVRLREFTINDPLDLVTGEIFREGADIVAFSVYIWNIDETLRVARRIKKVKKDTTIIMGGPEVSYDSREVMTLNPFIDFIVRGEGEITFRKLMEYLAEGKGDVGEIDGITFRKGDMVFDNRERELIKDLSTIPFPYQEEEDLENRIVYYEASRGCPFRCQYCLSSTIKGVRFMPLDRVKDDLVRLVKLGVKQVKFVDRTFNCNPDFALEIFRFLIELGGKTNFHFEISADLLNEDLVEVLKTAPPGLFQFEVGVQTTNVKVLKEICRKTSLPLLFRNVMEIKKTENIHQHLDLIAGLPGENMTSFAKSFNEVINLKPDMLQLGFLKLLKGSGIRERAKEYGYIYNEEPPYEVLGNKWMGYRDLLRLKLIEEVLEYYYNSHRFNNTIEYVLRHKFSSPFEFFLDLSEFWEQNGLHLVKHSAKKLYSLLYNYLTGKLGVPVEIINGLLKFDFLLSEKALVLPDPIKKVEIPLFKQRCYDFLGNPDNIKKYLPGYDHLSVKQVYKLVHFEVFSAGEMECIDMIDKKDTGSKIVILFDYINSDKIRGKARASLIEI
jgi:radical SAM superfamily enzyme YgiQ (UPF0313 family)